MNIFKKHMSREEFIATFDPEKYNWKYDSCTLVNFHSDKFDVWWDAGKFSWDVLSSLALASHCPEHFNKWWDTRKFKWTWGSFRALRDHCPDKVDVWFDMRKAASVGL